MFSIYLYGRTSQHLITYGLWMLASFYVAAKISRKLFTAYFVFSVLVALIYGSTALMYGRMSYATVTAILNTDPKEATEFIATIPLYVYIILFIYLIFSVIVYTIYQQIKNNKRKGKTFYILSILIFITLLVKPIKVFRDGYNEGVLLKSLRSISYYPFKLPAKFSYLTIDYLNTIKEFDTIKNSSDTFNITKITPKHPINVMIIGESMRRDYMSLYGYPYPTTPFLSKTPSIIWDNYISPSGSTALALERMLFARDTNNIEKSIYTNSVTALAKKAGFQQYWISNQGVFSRYNSAATIASLKADYRWFNSDQEKEFTSYSDIGLLNRLDYAINDSSTKPKLITLHISGSHSEFCSRISADYKIKYFNNSGDKKLDCYLNTLRQTDNFIENVYKKLQQTNKPFSILYFSDHGLSTFTTKLSGFHLTHNGKYKENFDSPMVILSSNDNKQTHIKSQKSGYNFMALFAHWLGIEEKTLKEKGIQMFNESTNEQVYVFNYRDVIKYSSLEEDEPATIV